MSSQYYQLSTEYDLANRILKEGGSIIQQAKSDFSGFFVITNSAGLGDNFDYLKESNTQFLLPIPDPTYELKTDLAEVQQQCSKLQHSLTQALNEADELRVKNDLLITECEKHREFASRFETYGVNGRSRIRFKLDPIGGRDRVYVEEDEFCQQSRIMQIMETEINSLRVDRANLNRLNDKLREKLNAVDECEAQNTYKALQYSKDRIDELININANLEREIKILQETLERTNSLHETQIHRRNIASQAQIESINALREQRDSLNQSQSDRLSELTSIMRMIQALSDTPQDKIDGAIYLIKRVLYDAICKLDPSQSWE